MIQLVPERTDPIKVLIVDDNDLVAETLLRCCEAPGLEAVGAASSGGTAIAMVEEHGPHVVLIDHRLGEEDGITVASAILESAPGTKVVVVTGDLTPEVRARAEDAGCWGCLEKTVHTGRAIPDLVQRAYAGEPL
jgi:DNA-binding NarL/FixJ family response regulator